MDLDGFEAWPWLVYEEATAALRAALEPKTAAMLRFLNAISLLAESVDTAHNESVQLQRCCVRFYFLIGFLIKKICLLNLLIY